MRAMFPYGAMLELRGVDGSPVTTIRKVDACKKRIFRAPTA